MKRIILLFFILSPPIVFAGGGLRGMGQAIELIITYIIITVLVAPPIIGFLASLLNPENRLQTFKKVTIYTLIILLSLLTLILFFFINS